MIILLDVPANFFSKQVFIVFQTENIVIVYGGVPAYACYVATTSN